MTLELRRNYVVKVVLLNQDIHEKDKVECKIAFIKKANP